MPHQRWSRGLLGLGLLLSACGEEGPTGVDLAPDGGSAREVGADGGASDGGVDGAVLDGGFDGGALDGGVDGGASDGSIDGGASDAGAPDASLPDAAAGPPVDAIWTWARNAPPQFRDGAGVGSADELAFVFGGRTGDPSNPPDTQRYNPWTDTWQVDPELGKNASRFPMSRDNGRVLFLVQGLTFTTLDPGIGYEILDGLTGRVLSARFPTPRAFPGLRLTRDHAFVIGGSCNGLGLCAYEPLRFDLETGAVRTLATLGAPGASQLRDFLSSPALGWTGTELVFYDGSAAHSAIWSEATDSWRPLSLPTPAPQPATWVDTGSSLLIYGEGAGAGYDYGSGTWRPLSSMNAPPSNSRYTSVWTGTEWLVFWDGGGAHYDPARDRWRPMNPNFAPEGLSAPMAWTGRELITFDRDRSYRYGPWVAGSTTCVGLGLGGLEAEIVRPSTRVVVSGSIPLEARTDGTQPITTLDWSIDGTPVGSGANTRVDVSTLSPGTHVLRLDAADLGGNTACHVRTLFIDPPPTLQGVVPSPGAIVLGTQQRFQARCSDDRPGCRVGLAVGSSSFGPPASVDEQLTFDASQIGVWVDYRVAAVDDRRQRDERRSGVLPIDDPKASASAVLEPKPCDVRDGHALYVDASSQFVIRNLASGTETVLEGGNVVCGRGNQLLRGGRAVTVDGFNVARYWDGSAVARRWNASTHRARERYVALARGLSLARLDLQTGIEANVGTMDATASYDLDAAGNVYWVNAAGALQRFSAAGGTTTLSPVVGTAAQIVAFSDGALWRERTGGSWAIVRHSATSGMTGNLVLSALAWGPLGPEANRDYTGAGTTVAFTAELAGTLQVLRVGSGGATTLTSATTEARVLSVESDGEIFTLEDGITLRFSPSAPTSTLWQVEVEAIYPDQDRTAFMMKAPRSGPWSVVEFRP